MTRPVRTTETLAPPVRTAALDERPPAGTSRVATGEEERIALSLLAFRRTATALHLPAIAIATMIRQVVRRDPDELDAILEAETRPA